jgi:hypothetical protein
MTRNNANCAGLMGSGSSPSANDPVLRGQAWNNEVWCKYKAADYFSHFETFISWFWVTLVKLCAPFFAAFLLHNSIFLL